MTHIIQEQNVLYIVMNYVILVFTKREHVKIPTFNTVYVKI